MKEILITLINWYQKYLKTLFDGRVCVFYPTCSTYTKEAIERYGALRGSFLGLRRILRCHPWQKNHIDPLK